MFTFNRTKSVHSQASSGAQIELVVGFDSESVLAIEHLPEGASYTLRASDGPSTETGATDLPVLLCGEGETTYVVIPSGADVMELAGGIERDGAELSAAHALRPCINVPGAQMLAVPPEGSVWVRHGNLLWHARRVAVADALPKAALRLRQHRWTLASAAVHGVALASLLFAPPPSRGLCMDGLARDDLRLVSAALLASELTPPELPFDLGKDDGAGSSGEKHAGDEGKAGQDKPTPSRGKTGLKKRYDTPSLPRTPSHEEVRSAGILGVLAKSMAGVNSTASVYGSELASGYDTDDAIGALLAQQVGANEGFNGLGLEHAGRGGGGDGVGTIGLDRIGTMGTYGSGGRDVGYGKHVGLGKHTDRVPRLIAHDAEVRGSLSKETIRRVIQRHLNEVRFCYEQALASRPELAGRVEVKFVIAPSGAVQASEVQKSTLGAPAAESCIRDAVRRWAFPAPDGGGVVIVSYPFVMQAAGE